MGELKMGTDEQNTMIEQARAEAKHEFAQLAVDLEKEVVAKERARVSAIFALPEAEGRAEMAMKLAVMDIAPEDAATLLGTAAKASGTGFVAAMAGLSSSDVGADSDSDDDGGYKPPKINAAEIFANRRAISAGK